MKRKRSNTPVIDKPVADFDAQAIDALYGLEPVIDLDSSDATSGEPTQFVSIDCPYCGEQYVTRVDLANGACTYIEDCQVCCQAMEIDIQLNDIGALRSVRTRRLDQAD